LALTLVPETPTLELLLTNQTFLVEEARSMPWRNLVHLRHVVLLLLMLVSFLDRVWPQEQLQAAGSSGLASNAALEQSVVELQKQVQELRAALQETNSEAARYHAQVVSLEQRLDATEKQLAARSDATSSDAQSAQRGPAEAQAAGGPNDDQSTESLSTEQRLAKVEEEQQLLGQKIDDQYQSKVESGSKYRVKFSGIVLFNLFGNRGGVDNLDVPTTAAPPAILDSKRNFGGTVRQSQLGFEVFGPDFAGAKTSGGVQFDFAGGFPAHSNAVNEGLMRLRTGTVRLDWTNTSVIVGQDKLFISPLDPTSFATLAVPALSYAGNLWSWTPQLRVEHKTEITSNSSLELQAGFLDSLTGETPATPAFQYFRQPVAGERSLQPAYAARVGWTYNAFGRPFTMGLGGYFGRQKWGFRRVVDGWAGTSDWSWPFARWLALSGEFYRGQAIGGLGGGLGRSTFWTTPLTDPATVVKGLDSLGGWSQLKIKPTDTKIEFNLAYGQDNPFAHQVQGTSGAQLYFNSVTRNRSSFANVIYRPHSALVLALEFRRMQTFGIDNSSEISTHVNASMGIIF
jgi:hypothetical protein